MAAFSVAVVCALALSVLAASDLQCASSPPSFVSRGSFSVPSPAFLLVAPNGHNESSLFISQFFVNPFKEGSMSVVNNLPAGWPNAAAYKATEAFEYVWPNRAAPVPASVFGNPHLFTVAGGFLVPGKSTGAVSIVDWTDPANPRLFKISTDKSGFFYHEALWYDVDGDGKLDIVTARVNKPVIGSSQGELLWYRNPGQLKADDPWELHVLLDGPDVFFRVADLNGDGKPEIVAAEFFSERLVVYACGSAAPGGCQQTDSWQVVLSDTTIGALFDVSVVDLNRDGRLDLLVTNHVNNVTISGVYAYEVPAVLRPGALWPRHVLALGFKVIIPGANQAAPGSAKTFHPHMDANAKPWLLVAGDGAAQAYILEPLSAAPADWRYACSVLVATPHHGTVGEPAITDVDGDGHADLFVPDYDHSTIYVFSAA